jgi:quercetin dioxygenase-like cupin family protein
MLAAMSTTSHAPASFFLLDSQEWADERKAATVPPEVIEQAERAGARRKFLARGEAGFFSQYSEMPAGYTVAPHTHSQDELIVVLAGGCQVIGGPEMKAGDSVAIGAGFEYGFVCGSEGMHFLTIRRDASQTTFTTTLGNEGSQ